MINSPLEDIEAAALQLAPAERAHLAERLLVSLDEDDEIMAAWVEEAERRANAFDRASPMTSLASPRYMCGGISRLSGAGLLL